MAAVTIRDFDEVEAKDMTLEEWRLYRPRIQREAEERERERCPFRAYIPGPPVPWQRTRGHGGRRFTGPRYKSWSICAELVLRAARRQPEPLDCLLGLRVEVNLPRPKRRPSYVSRELWDGGAAYMCRARGDVDNYLKAAADCLQRAGIIEDDALLVEVSARKQIACRAGTPGLEVTLYRPAGLMASSRPRSPSQAGR